MAITHGATDRFSLGAGWEPQSSDSNTALQRITSPKANGDTAVQNGITEVESRNCTYIYTGAETAFVAAIEAAGAWPGQVTGGMLVTEIRIAYADCASGKKPKVTFTGRDGIDDDSNIYKTAVVLPTYAEATVEVPNLFTATLGDAEPADATYIIRCQFEPDLGKTGDVLSGETYNGEEQIDMAYKGTPTSVTTTGYIATTTTEADTNTGYPDATVSGVKNIARYVVT
jgi:hypothetical protein